MESLDLELELNDLHYNSHFDADFDLTTEIDEFSERIIERSKPKPAKIKREISRLAEPYQPANNSATGGEASPTDWISIVVGSFYEMPKRSDIRYGLERWRSAGLACTQRAGLE